MSSLEIISRSFLELAGKQLLYSSLLVGLVWIICARLEQRAPRLQLSLWTLVIVRLALPPSLAFSWSLRGLLQRWTHLEPTAGSGELAMGLAPHSTSPAILPTSPHEVVYWPLILCGVWLMGCLAVSLRLLYRWRQYRHIAVDAKVLAEEPNGNEWQPLVKHWSQRFGVRRKVLLVTSDASTEPFTLGWLKPRIFLPKILIDNLPREQVAAIVAHEMAHVSRFDSLRITVHCVIRSLYFFHPLLWLASSRIDQARERICDEMVLSTGAVSRRNYGECLLASLRQQIPPMNPSEATPVPTFSNDKRRVSMRLQNILRFRSAHRQDRKLAMVVPCLLGVLLLPMGKVTAERAVESNTSSDSLDAPSSIASTSGELSPQWASPLPGARVTSPFGFRKSPLDKESESHQGIDLAAAKGSRVLAPADAKVEIATERLKGQENYGTIVVLDHGNGIKSRYAHLAELMVEPHQSVRAGDPIGTQGNTGVSSGPHLHFEIWRNGEAIDPALAISSW